MPFEHGPSLVQASSWIAAFRGRSVVIKVGGEALTKRSSVDRIARQIKVMTDCGLRCLIVHGAGVQVDEACKAKGITPEKIGGRRVTSPEVLEVLVHVLADLNASLCRELAQHGLATQGMDEGVQKAILCTRRPPTEKDGKLVDWGEVGDISGVDVSVLAQDRIPVLPSLAWAEDGPKNANADSCSSHLAIAVKAAKLIFVTATPGVMRSMDDAGPISEVSADEAKKLLDSGIATGGMKAKLEECLRAVRGGVEQVHILGSREPFGMLREIFTDEGVGTLIRS
jgi:acetylglutamate kinase